MLLMLLTACGTLQLQIDDPHQTVRVTAPVPTSPSLPPPSTAAVPTATPDPTSTPGPTPIPSTPTSAPSTLAPAPEPQRIHFAAGATSATVYGSLTPNRGGQRYVLRALAGQMLQVDIVAQQPVVLDVSGQNGTILALERLDQTAGTAHWEGGLPSTQDYLITLSPVGATSAPNDYELTVAIPSLPDPTPDFSVYHNAEYGFEVRYPSDFGMGCYPSDFGMGCYPSDFGMGLTCPIITAAGIHDPLVSFRLVGDTYYDGTNLLDACVTIGVDQSEAGRSTCTGLRDPREDHWGQQEINGVLFSIVSHGGVAAGHIHDALIYRTLHAEACYEVNLFLRYSSMGVYTPGTVSEFDKHAVMSRLDQVLKSITIIQ
jgi:hypothetical protein